MKKSILATSPFLIVNKSLLTKIGLDASVVLSDLIQKEQYFKENSLLTDRGFFFNTTPNISCSTTLSYYQIKQSLATLTKWGIIEVVRRGIPAKLHFKILHTKLSKILISSVEKNEELDCENFNNKILKNSNSINKNKEIIIKNKNKDNTRKVSFLNDLKDLTPKDYIEDFLDYWTEENKAGKQRWELEKTWNTSLRYKRWVRNQKNFSRGSGTNNMPDFWDNNYYNRIKDDETKVKEYQNYLVNECGYRKKISYTGQTRWVKK